MAMMGDAPTLRTLAFRVLAKTGTPRGTNAGHERDNLSQRPVWPGTGKTMLPQGDHRVVPLSHALGLGHWDTTATSGTALGTDVGQAAEAQRISDPHARAFTVLRARCPDHVEEERWRQCVADAERFLGRWGEQAEALGWTAKDLFGLHKPPEKPPSVLQPPIPLRRDRPDLAAAGPGNRGAHRGDRRDPEFDRRHRRHHALPQAQQAGARPGRRQLGRFAMTHNHVSEARR